MLSRIFWKSRGSRSFADPFLLMGPVTGGEKLSTCTSCALRSSIVQPVTCGVCRAPSPHTHPRLSEKLRRTEVSGPATRCPLGLRRSLRVIRWDPGHPAPDAPRFLALRRDVRWDSAAVSARSVGIPDTWRRPPSCYVLSLSCYPFVQISDPPSTMRNACGSTRRHSRSPCLPSSFSWSFELCHVCMFVHL